MRSILLDSTLLEDIGRYAEETVELVFDFFSSHCPAYSRLVTAHPSSVGDTQRCDAPLFCHDSACFWLEEPWAS